MHTHSRSPSTPDMAFLSRPAASSPPDVVFYVGKHRHTFHVHSDNLLRSSAYFRNLFDAAPHMLSQPIVLDCEEGIFESLLLLMRYGTLEALPPMSASEIYRVKKEADFYGIHYAEPSPRKSEMSNSDDGSSDLSCSSPCCSSAASSSPKSMMHMSPPAGHRIKHGRCYEGIRIACATPRQLAELQEFPVDLADPARLVLVSCLDEKKAAIYTCDCACAATRTQWALNFHHRHAFCTACGRTPDVAPKHFAEMFMAAAAHYHALANPGQGAGPMDPHRAWRVSSDSTCLLRFLSSAADGADACGCSAGVGRAAREAQPTIWAANSFFSHAFCTCCSEVAKGPVLLSLMLAVRYGGSNLNKASRSARSSFRMGSHTCAPHGQPTTQGL